MKKKRRLGGDEIISARDKFKGALQDLLPHSDEDSDLSDDNIWASKSKRSAASKKKQVEKQPENDSNKFVMKLFDRSVDLAQFTDNTPLYPICRAWIANQPNLLYNVKKEQVKNEISDDLGYSLPKNAEDFDSVRDTFKLPPPDPRPPSAQSLRRPAVIPYVSEIEERKGDDLPSREELMADNLSHWSKVRKSWMEASAKNEARYEKSTRILTAIFNKTQKQFQNV